MSTQVLLSGFVGALLVFCLGRFRENRRDKRELRGHLLLLSSELSHNATVPDVYRNNPELMYIFVAGAPLLRTNSRSSTVRTDNTPKVRFSAKLGQEPEA
jgi:hypothetical protein